MRPSRALSAPAAQPPAAPLAWSVPQRHLGPSEGGSHTPLGCFCYLRGPTHLRGTNALPGVSAEGMVPPGDQGRGGGGDRPLPSQARHPATVETAGATRNGRRGLLRVRRRARNAASDAGEKPWCQTQVKKRGRSRTSPLNKHSLSAHWIDLRARNPANLWARCGGIRCPSTAVSK